MLAGLQNGDGGTSAARTIRSPITRKLVFPSEDSLLLGVRAQSPRACFLLTEVSPESTWA